MGGVNCEVAVLFIDMVGSTRLAGTLPPEELVAMLNEFFAVVIDVIERHGGVINKFEGDAALAIFGARCRLTTLPAVRYPPQGTERPAELAGREINFGIGVSAGMAAAGNVGDPSRYEYTVIGDPVNEAARLAEVAKLSGGVVASGAALSRASHAETNNWRVTESMTLRGRDQPTDIAVPRANA